MFLFKDLMFFVSSLNTKFKHIYVKYIFWVFSNTGQTCKIESSQQHTRNTVERIVFLLNNTVSTSAMNTIQNRMWNKDEYFYKIQIQSPQDIVMAQRKVQTGDFCYFFKWSYTTIEKTCLSSCQVHLF